LTKYETMTVPPAVEASAPALVVENSALRGGRETKAMSAFSPPDGADASDLERVFDHAFTYYLRADYERAIPNFTAALRLDPASFPLLAYRGDAYRLICEYDRAIADYNAALQLHPASAPVLVQRATAYRLDGKSRQAVADARTWLKSAMAAS